jgi:hypothetical protein
MSNENLLATLEQTLRQTRTARARLQSRLAELESELETVRREIGELNQLIEHTEEIVFRFVSGSVKSELQMPKAESSIPSAAGVITEYEYARPRSVERRDGVPQPRPDIEVKSDRFADRTIPQATAMLLRESGEPLHVNEIYNRLLEGGFAFTGHNPTISIAVSLNRNGRFRKVAPGTFDLVIRDASQAS